MNSSAATTVDGAQSQQWAAFLGQVGNSAYVKDTVVARGLTQDTVFCLVVLVGFVLVRPHNVVYFTRLLDRTIVRRPPRIPTDNWQWLWSWLIPTFLLSDEEILHTAGLDAIMYLRIIGLGIKFFLPLTLLAYCTLVPIHLFALGGFDSELPFTSFSMIRVPHGSTLLWIHFVFIHIVVAWACYLCFETYKTFVVLRQNYLAKVIHPDEMVPSQAELPTLVSAWRRWREQVRQLLSLCWFPCGAAERAALLHAEEQGGEGEELEVDDEDVEESLGVVRHQLSSDVGPATAATILARDLDYLAAHPTVAGRDEGHNAVLQEARRLMNVLDSRKSSSFSEYGRKRSSSVVINVGKQTGEDQRSSAGGSLCNSDGSPSLHSSEPTPSGASLRAVASAPEEDTYLTPPRQGHTSSSQKLKGLADSTSKAVVVGLTHASPSPESKTVSSILCPQSGESSFINAPFRKCEGSLISAPSQGSPEQASLDLREVQQLRRVRLTMPHQNQRAHSSRSLLDRGGQGHWPRSEELRSTESDDCAAPDSTRSADVLSMEVMKTRKSVGAEPRTSFTRPAVSRCKSERHLDYSVSPSWDRSTSSNNHATPLPSTLGPLPQQQCMTRTDKGVARVCAVDHTAASSWWENFGHTVELEPNDQMITMPEWLSRKVKQWSNHSQGKTVKSEKDEEEVDEEAVTAPRGGEEEAHMPSAGDDDEDWDEEGPEESQRSGRPRRHHSATHAATVAVMSKPCVMSLKTVAATLPTGEDCRVMSELYAVLVTGIPNLQRQRDLLRAREEKEKASPFSRGVIERQSPCRTPSSPETQREEQPQPLRHTCPAIAQHHRASSSLSIASPKTPAFDVTASLRVFNSPSTYDLPSEHPCSSDKLEQRRMTYHLGENGKGPSSRTAKRRVNGLGGPALDVGTIELTVVEADEEAESPTSQQVESPTRTTISSRSLLSQNDVVAAVFQQLFPHTFFCVVPIHKDNKVEKLLFKWENLSRKLEVAKKKEELWGRRPMVRSGGFCCFGGTLVDAEGYYARKVATVEEEIKAARELALARDPAQSCFVLFTDQFSATVAAQSVIHPEDGHMFRTEPAPGPDDVNWTGLWSSRRQRFISSALAWPFLAFFILFPVGFFSASVMEIDAAMCSSGNTAFANYCQGHDSGKLSLQMIVTSPLIPSLLLSFWQTVVMPHALYFLSVVQADSPSQSQLDRKIAKYFIVWGVVNVFLGGMLGGMVQVVSLISDPSRALNVIGESAVQASNFFIQLVQVQAFIIAPLAMIHPHAGVWVHLLARLLHKRAGGCCLLDKDVAKTWIAKSYRYGKEIPIHLNIFMLGLAYSTAQPAILLYCLVYFSLFWVVRRYQTIYVFERCYESGGLVWPMVFNAITHMLFLFQVFMSAVLIFFGASVQAGVLFLTIPAGLYTFRAYCHRRFDIATTFLPLELGDRAPPAMVEPALYVSPPLRNGAAGWHPEVRKAWDGYGMAAGVF